MVKPTTISALNCGVFLIVFTLGCDKPAPPLVMEEPESSPRHEYVVPLSPPADGNHVAGRSGKSSEEKSPLEIAYDLQAVGLAGPRLQRALADAHAELPALEAPSTEPTVWQRVTLNRTGAKFDAIRIRSPLSSRADLVWAFAAKEDTTLLSWQIVSPGGAIAGSQGTILDSSNYFYRNNVVLSGVDLPAENSVVLAKVSGGQFESDVDYYLCFLFADAAPTDFYVKLAFVKPDSSPPTSTVHSLAEKLDIKLPFRFSSAASLQNRIADSFAYEGPGAAAKLIDEEETKGATERTIRFARALLRHETALQLVSQGNRDGATPLFLEAAAACRQFHERYPVMSDDESELFTSALYNEACALALAGELDRALASLREALASDPAVVSYMQHDPDLKSLRDTEGYQQLLREVLRRQEQPVPGFE